MEFWKISKGCLLYIDLRSGQAIKITGVSGRRISGYYNFDRGLVEWVRFVTPIRRWTLNYYTTQCTGISISWRSDELEIRCGRENQHPERLGPQALGWAAQENGKETRLWLIEWESICCSSVRSPTPSHTQPFQIKWEVYFSKNCVARLYCVLVMILHACICICIVGHGYTTPGLLLVLNHPEWYKQSI